MYCKRRRRDDVPFTRQTKLLSAPLRRHRIGLHSLVPHAALSLSWLGLALSGWALAVTTTTLFYNKNNAVKRIVVEPEDP